MATKVFLSSRSGRQKELQDCAADLAKAGYDITCRWLDLPLANDKGMGATTTRDQRRLDFARQNLHDIRHCDLLIAFTENPKRQSRSSRGRRHVEYGAGLGHPHIKTVVCGPAENVYHTLADNLCIDWDSVMKVLGKAK